MLYACKGAHTLITNQKEREREWLIKSERDKEREWLIKSERDKERERERERDVEYVQNCYFYS